MPARPVLVRWGELGLLECTPITSASNPLRHQNLRPLDAFQQPWPLIF